MMNLIPFRSLFIPLSLFRDCLQSLARSLKPHCCGCTMRSVVNRVEHVSIGIQASKNDCPFQSRSSAAIAGIDIRIDSDDLESLHGWFLSLCCDFGLHPCNPFLLGSRFHEIKRQLLLPFLHPTWQSVHCSTFGIQQTDRIDARELHRVLRRFRRSGNREG